MGIIKKLQQYLSSSKDSLKKSPIECLLAIILLGISLYLNFSEYVLGKLSNSERESIAFFEEFNAVLVYSFVLFAITYASNVIFTKKLRFLYYASSALPILAFIFFLFKDPQQWYKFEITAVINICALLLMFAASRHKNNKEFVTNALRISINVAWSILLSAVTAGLLYTIIESLSFIFAVTRVPSIIFSINTSLCIFFLPIILFLTLEGKSLVQEYKIGKALTILVNYILTPSIIIYGIILYIYFAKIVITWNLPEGIVSTTAIIFILSSLCVSLFRTLQDKKVMNWVFDKLAYISLPALVLFWVGVVYRINEYGISGTRMYLLLLLIILTLWNFASLSKKYGRFQYLTISVIISFVLFSYIPKIGYNGLEKIADNNNKESNEDKIESIYLYQVKEKHTLNIEEYSKMYLERYYSRNLDTLIIKDSDEKIVFKESSRSVLNQVFENIGVENFQNYSEDYIEKECSDTILYYKSDSAKIIFTGLSYDKIGDEIKNHCCPIKS